MFHLLAENNQKKTAAHAGGVAAVAALVLPKVDEQVKHKFLGVALGVGEYRDDPMICHVQVDQKGKKVGILSL